MVNTEIQSAKTRSGADCGSDHELLIAKLKLKLKKVGKTARYTVEMRTRFRGLYLIDRVPDELWTGVCDIVQETGIKTIPKRKKCKKSKMAEEALQIAETRRDVKGKEEQERYTYLMQSSKE